MADRITAERYGIKAGVCQCQPDDDGELPEVVALGPGGRPPTPEDSIGACAKCGREREA